MTVAFRVGANLLTRVESGSVIGWGQMGETQQTVDLEAAKKTYAALTTAIITPDALAAAIVESCSDAIIPTSVDGTIIGWNAAATELLGYTADEVIGQPWHHLVPTGNGKELARAGRRLENGERSIRLTTRLRRKDGVEFETGFLMSPVRDRAGVLIGFSGIIRDITQEKIAERKLRQNEEKFKTVFKNSTDSISLASMDGRYIDINDEFCRMVHRPPEEIIGKTPADLGIISEAQQEGLAQITLQNGGLRNHEVTVVDPFDGVAHRLLLSVAMVELDGAPCVLGIIKDISELRRAEDELLRLERQFNEVLANAPLAMIAFDTNRVITAARGRALERSPLEATQLIGRALAEVFLSTNPALKNADRAL